MTLDVSLQLLLARKLGVTLITEEVWSFLTVCFMFCMAPRLPERSATFRAGDGAGAALVNQHMVGQTVRGSEFLLAYTATIWQHSTLAHNLVVLHVT